MSESTSSNDSDPIRNLLDSDGSSFMFVNTNLQSVASSTDRQPHSLFLNTGTPV